MIPYLFYIIYHMISYIENIQYRILTYDPILFYMVQYSLNDPVS